MEMNNKQNYRTDLRAEVDKILLSDPTVQAGLMFGYPAYYVNGKLALCHYEDGIALKLPEEKALHLREVSKLCEPFRPMGKRMGANWVIINPDEATDIRKFSETLIDSIAYLKQLTS